MSQENESMVSLIAVDDEVDTKVLYEYFFRNEIATNQIEFSFLTDSEQCVKKLDKKSNNTLVLLDINLPGISGIELLKLINDKYQGVKVIMVSAYTSGEVYDRCIKFGAIDYIEKPVNFEVLKNKIMQIIEKL